MRIAPLTVLVGENSTGKTSFLAATRIIADVASGNFRPDFNEQPFLLGSYDQIAYVRKGPHGRSKSFDLSLTVTVPAKSAMPADRLLQRELPLGTAEPNGRNVELQVRFHEMGSHPEILELSVATASHRLSATFLDAFRVSKLEIMTPAGQHVFDAQALKEFKRIPPSGMPIYYFFEFLLRNIRLQPEIEEHTKITRDDVSGLIENFDFLRRYFPARPYAGAPVRTRPLRTYDPVTETPKPEGEHVPMLLAKLYAEKKEQWTRLKSSLDAFGKASGLFDSITVRQLGNTASDPFQIRVQIAGLSQNLIDVGYGVSQVLPIIVDALRGRGPAIFLLQQPEVHLHPKGQAELATFLATVARTGRTRFIVETHSDHFVDRLRIDVRDRQIIRPKDVSILFFERYAGEVNISPILLDEQGNLRGAPKNYRRFFLDEERQLVGV